MKKTKVLTGAILLAALAGVLYFLFYYSRALDTRDYISVSFQGVNGNGSSKVSVKSDLLKKDIQKAIRGHGKNPPSTLEASSFFDETDLFTVRCTPEKKLKNGDKVKVHVAFDNKRWKPYGFRFRSKSFTVKVNHLAKGKTCNPFDGYTLPLHGIAPFGYVKAEELCHNGVTFICTPGTGLQAGDTVVLEVDERTLPKDVIPSETTRKYQLSDMPAFVMNASDLTEQNFKTLFYDLKERLEAPALYEGLTPVIYHARSLSKSGSDRQERLKDLSIEEIVMDTEGILYARKEEKAPQNICIWPYRIHFTKDGKAQSGYGAAVVHTLIRQENGELTFQDGAGDLSILPSTDIYFDRADLQRALSVLEDGVSSGMEKKTLSYTPQKRKDKR